MKKALPILVAGLAFANIALGQAKEKAGGGDDRVERKQVITNARYFGVGLGYVAGLSKNSPYKAGVSVHDVFGFSVFKNRMVIEEQIGFDVRFVHNRDWNTRAYNGWNGSTFLHILPFFSAEVTLGAYPVIVNKSRFAAMAGPMVGLTAIDAMSASGDILVNTKAFHFKPCYGLKASAFVGQHFIFSAQYLMMPITKVDAGTPDFPVTFNALRVGATYHRGPSTWLKDKLAARKAKKKAAATGAGSSQ